MDTVKLTARARNGSGKSYTRKIRQQGWVPAAFYGYGVEPINIEVDYREFAKLIEVKSQNKLIELVGEGIPADSVAVIRSYDNDAIKETLFYHIDFQKVVEGRPVKTRSYVNLVGKSAGVALGHILNQPVHEIAVEGPVDAITATVDLDISNLNAPGDLCKAKDIQLPEGVKLGVSDNQVICRLFK